MTDKDKKIEKIVRVVPRKQSEEGATAETLPPTAAPVVGGGPGTPSVPKPVAKRAVLKTLNRVAAPPLPPTLRSVTGGMKRRVVPKAPPRPVVPIPPPAQPKAPEVPVLPVASVPNSALPITGTPSTPMTSSVAKPVTPPPSPAKEIVPALTAKTAIPPPVAAPSALPKAAPVVPAPEKKKEPTKFEPTATYKMPTTPLPPLRTGVRGPMTKPTASPGIPTPIAAGSTVTASTPLAPAAARKRIKIAEIITVKDLAEKMAVKPIDLIKKLLSLGTMVTINQPIDSDTATLVADAFNVDVEMVPLVGDGAEVEEAEDPALLKPRSPIVTIMGHVDHGKTSLLDTIRKTRVAEKEAGGITQHIGAYRVPTSKGDVVFLDTPGHEAFTAMRARGAKVTDIVVLVVAADDGVMPQTVEAIDHARAAGVPIVVAVNKIDLPTANVEKIKRELADHQLLSEEWGGKTIFVEVSAKRGTNVDKLLEMLSLEAELLELKANPNRAGQGVVVEARLDPRRGVTASLMVQRGTLKVGDVVVAGMAFGRIRALLDDHGQRIQQAVPSTPVEILGLSTVPLAGDRFVVMKDEREARALVEKRQEVHAEESLRKRHVTLETLHQRVAEGKIRELKIILKADVQGSVQALRDSLEKISTDQIRLSVIHSGAGGISETDVALAAASDAVIIGFNVKPDTKAEEIARREEVDVKSYKIIYEAIADVRAAMEGLLEPEEVETKLGKAEVRQVFRVTKGGTIAGSMVLDGKLTRGGKARVLRSGTVVHDGVIDSLKRFKDDVREVEKGFECGIGIANFQDVKPQDLIEGYMIETKARRLETKS